MTEKWQIEIRQAIVRAIFDAMRADGYAPLRTEYAVLRLWGDGDIDDFGELQQALIGWVEHKRTRTDAIMRQMYAEFDDLERGSESDDK
jgi:hypothetical protein